ncbi:MAG: Rpn family recombination-promoting nuclease/putative transposase, partial [Firmicutes bacterium]|nr:Rpn family recombination-promoting nuclease/putative transposase [Bacillota bacterium]
IGKQKDLAEKKLLNQPDVLADVLNAFLFEGKEVVQEKDIYPYLTNSSLFTTKLKELQRDSLSLWKPKEDEGYLIGIENQTHTDSKMALRVMAYNTVSYLDQFGKRKGQFFPAVTYVFYYGNKHWKKNKKLSELFNQMNLVEKLFQDHGIEVVEIAFLEREVIERLKSDFYIVADYFEQVRTKKVYIPPNRELKHPFETCYLMYTLTNDKRFLEITEQNGGVKNMCEAFDYYENRGIEKGRHEERQKCMQEAELERQNYIQEAEQKRRNWLLDAIKRNMSEGFSFQQIMKIFGISQDEQNYYFQKLQEE